MNFLESLGDFGTAIYFSFVAAAICGWFMNIVALISMAGGVIGSLFVLRVVGVFLAPLGSILGLFC